MSLAQLQPQLVFTIFIEAPPPIYKRVFDFESAISNIDLIDFSMIKTNLVTKIGSTKTTIHIGQGTPIACNAACRVVSPRQKSKTTNMRLQNDRWGLERGCTLDSWVLLTTLAKTILFYLSSRLSHSIRNIRHGEKEEDKLSLRWASSS